jgi:signal transduction histidine kinase
MPKNSSSWKIVLVAVIVAFTLSLHYMVLPYPPWVHLIHRRLCYIPILLAGLWFGFRGGIIVSSIISLATLPLVFIYPRPFWSNQDLIEITFYMGLGILTGVLVDRKDAERARREALQEKLRDSERLASLGRMASGIAHEVRTPLGSIQGVAEILAEDYPADHPRRPFFDILTQEIDRLKKVVKDFLDLSRPIKVEPTALHPYDVVGACFQSLKGPADEKGVRLEHVPKGNCRVFADASRMHQVLTNLVRNGIQFSPEGGAVEVRTEARKDGCLLVVEDGGPGLPEESERIFEPFFTSRKDGTGLGLALVTQIVHAHGGWIKAENRAEKGARFTVWLPGGAGRNRDEGTKAII